MGGSKSERERELGYNGGEEEEMQREGDRERKEER